MTEPTPPPWLIEIGSGGYLAVTNKDGKVIAWITDENYANAYLIAASPELRDACETMLPMIRFRQSPPEEEEAVAMLAAELSIASAKGEITR